MTDETKSEVSQMSSVDQSKLPVEGNTQKKTDEITALQDSIDRLSLAMFEALRGLRDAVAPESGNVGGTTAAASSTAADNNTTDPDFEEFYQAYRNGDRDTVAAVQKASANDGANPPASRQDLVRIHAKIETEKDVELVSRLSSTVLEKSIDVNARVSALPGMNRTRTEQMKIIEELLQENQAVGKELDEQFRRAQERREQVRKVVRERTGEALGIDVVGE